MVQGPFLRIDVPLPGSGAAEPIFIDYAGTGPVARLVTGARADAMPAMIGRLFTICAEAQQLASRVALAAAQNLEIDGAELEMARHGVSLEAVRETGLHILLGWPALLEEAPDNASGAALLAATQGGGDARALDEVLTGAVFGCSPGQWLAEQTGGGATLRWAFAGATPAARLLARAIDASAVPIHPAPAPGSPVDRCARQMFVAQLDPGSLASHHAARLFELARLAAPHIAGTPHAAFLAAQSDASGHGRAEIACARGTLVHEVEVAEGRIARCEMRSPTDVAFAPYGPGRMWLQTVADGTLSWPREEREAVMREVLAAIDPCMEYRLTFASPAAKGAL
ncbi:hypothetical protein [Novosphingobium mangrovi (ex Hu et al. 2023)]|uniref:Hydrogenase expression/formation protein HupK n=1 Tax=Novosphingobium mangrovi (ex Hu et al. 2023) TaxID=2930094 RepID=A0ABT0ADK8_9SPHN|nr:hypothetical protein [Novosphingobium mangrovi (ex Hu et al. 2023)]MCJ1961244.1 hypothetical protein [Novosphingobium mangrovi (ex Hu et al. 2023)]